MNRRWTIVTAGVVILGLAGGYAFFFNRKSDSLFKTARVEQGTIDQVITATGMVNPVVAVKVGTQVSGTISELYADFNSPVKEGQVVARLDPATFEAQVAQASASLDVAQKNLEKGEADVEESRTSVSNARAKVAQSKGDLAKAEANFLSARAETERAKVLARDAEIKLARAVRLVQEGIQAQSERDSALANYDTALASVKAADAQVVAGQAQVEASRASLDASETQIEAAEARVKSFERQLKSLTSKVQEARANLALAKVNLERTIIRSPVSGIVISRDVDVGQTVAASLQSPTLFTIAQDLTRMQVDTSTDEADIGSIVVGQVATFTVDAYPDVLFEGKISQIRMAPIISQNVITYTTVITVANPDLRLRPGMTANVSILVNRREGVLKIPNAALRFVPQGAGQFRGGRPLGQAGSRSSEVAQPGAGKGPGRGGQRVWVLDKDKKPRPVLVKLGLSDGTYSEVVAGGLSEGQEVILSLAAKEGEKPPAGGPGRPPGFGGFMRF